MPAFPPSLRPCHIPYLSFLISRSLPTPTPLCTRIAWFNQFLLSRTVLCLPTSLSLCPRFISVFCFASEAKIDSYSVVKSSSSVRPFASVFSLYTCAPRSPDLRQGVAELSVSGYWSHTDTHTWNTHTMSNALLMGGWLTRDQIRHWFSLLRRWTHLWFSACVSDCVCVCLLWCRHGSEVSRRIMMAAGFVSQKKWAQTRRAPAVDEYQSTDYSSLY